jgi:hypothetical protein
MRNLFYLVMCVFCAFIMSCTNEREEAVVSNNEPQQINLLGMIVENRNGTLVFESNEQLIVSIK